MRRLLLSGCALFALVAGFLACSADSDGNAPGDIADGAADAPPTSSDAATVFDASTLPDAESNDGGGNADASPDAGCQATELLVGGTDVTAQGWKIVQQAPATLTYGEDYVRLETSTPDKAKTGGQLLLAYSGAVTQGTAFKISVEMLVESVDAHNPLDSAAAIMGSLTGAAGTQPERKQMVYLDSAKLGWADDSASFNKAIVDGNYHTYVLSVGADGIARVSVDGAQALTRNGYATNGTIAIGDQTNDPKVDSALRIRSVKKLCVDP